MNNHHIDWDYEDEMSSNEFETLKSNYRAFKLVESVVGYGNEMTGEFTIRLINGDTISYSSGVFHPYRPHYFLINDQKIDFEEYMDNYVPGYGGFILAAVNMYIDHKLGILIKK